MREYQRFDALYDVAEREEQEREPEPRGWPGKRTRVLAELERWNRGGRALDRGAAAHLERAASSPGSALPEELRGRLERATGMGLESVRLHTGAESAAAARAIGARAYTVGQDIHFAHGAYAPETVEGGRLIAHEVAHTVQQRGVAGVDGELEVSSPADREEVDALAFADRFAEGHDVPAPLAPAPRSSAARAIVQRKDESDAPGGHDCDEDEGAPSGEPKAKRMITVRLPDIELFDLSARNKQWQLGEGSWTLFEKTIFIAKIPVKVKATAKASADASLSVSAGPGRVRDIQVSVNVADFIDDDDPNPVDQENLAKEIESDPSMLDGKTLKAEGTIEVPGKASARLNAKASVSGQVSDPLEIFFGRLTAGLEGSAVATAFAKVSDHISFEYSDHGAVLENEFELEGGISLEISINATFTAEIGIGGDDEECEEEGGLARPNGWPDAVPWVDGAGCEAEDDDWTLTWEAELPVLHKTFEKRWKTTLGVAGQAGGGGSQKIQIPDKPIDLPGADVFDALKPMGMEMAEEAPDEDEGPEKEDGPDSQDLSHLDNLAYHAVAAAKRAWNEEMEWARSHLEGRPLEEYLERLEPGAITGLEAALEDCRRAARSTSAKRRGRAQGLYDALTTNARMYETHVRAMERDGGDGDPDTYDDAEADRAMDAASSALMELRAVWLDERQEVEIEHNNCGDNPELEDYRDRLEEYLDELDCIERDEINLLEGDFTVHQEEPDPQLRGEIMAEIRDVARDLTQEIGDMDRPEEPEYDSRYVMIQAGQLILKPEFRGNIRALFYGGNSQATKDWMDDRLEHRIPTRVNEDGKKEWFYNGPGADKEWWLVDDPAEKPTVEHVADVAGHWNTIGNATTQEERKLFYNKMSDAERDALLEIMPLRVNSATRKKDGTFSPNVRMSFWGPGGPAGSE